MQDFRGALMTFRGTIQNGRVELEPGTDLPDGTIVRVEPVRMRQRRPRRAGKSTRGLIDPAYRLGELAVSTGITDLAAEHDHYIYGTPKRGRRRAARGPKGRSKRS